MGLQRSKTIALGLLITTLVGVTACNQSPFGDASPTNSAIAQTAGPGQPLDNQDFATVLTTYVDDQGLVDYAVLQANREALDKYVQAIGAVPQATYEQWPESEKIAYLINAYNAITLQAIIDQSPLKASIRDIPGVWKWNKHQVAGQSLTLDQIEHSVLRQNFNEPRIHMALVCAAKSCPYLRQEPYTGDRLDEQLTEQTQRFLNHPEGFAIDPKDQKVELSAIFNWFGKDWIKSYQVSSGYQGNDQEKAVLNFVGEYLSPEQQAFLEQGDYQIRYFNYDWSLNNQS